MSEKIMTLHPDPNKAGVNISKSKYDLVRAEILSIIKENSEISFKDLMAEMASRLPEFHSSIGWYTTTVKLDLEARHLIERSLDKTSQVLRLKNP